MGKAGTAGTYDVTVLFDSLENGGKRTLALSRAGVGETPATQLCGAVKK
jgi:hypothetical protein